jgi:hypothetical protein
MGARASKAKYESRIEFVSTMLLENYICLGIVNCPGFHVLNIVSCWYVGNPNLAMGLVANKRDLDSKWKIEVNVELLFFGSMLEFITW